MTRYIIKFPFFFCLVLVPCLLLPSLSWAESQLKCGPGGQGKVKSLAIGGLAVAPGPTKSLLGANVLYFIDDDKTWNAGLGEKLNRLRLSALRFPGGEVADQYDWEKGGKEKLGISAGNDGSEDFAPFTDGLEFLKRAKVAGIPDIYFVVNLEGAFVAPGDRGENIRRYAEKAARWVAEVKRQGFVVKYWEIGNESNHDSTTFTLTAAEYAGALAIFSREMKRADPQIKIAANGPTGVNASGFADKFTKEQLEFFRGKGRKLCGKKPEKGCIEKIRQVIPGTVKPVAWWDVLAARAGRDFDMAVIHSYSMVKLPKSFEKSESKEMRQVQRLRERLEQETGRRIAISVTEWNVPPKRRENIASGDAALANVIKLGNYLAAGVEHALFWPLRYPDSERALLTMDGLEVTPMYRAFEAVAPVMNGAYAGQKVLAAGVYALKTNTTSGERVMLVNTGNHPLQVDLRLQDGRSHEVQVNQLTGENMSGGETCRGSSIENGVSITLPPGSLTTAILSH